MMSHAGIQSGTRLGCMLTIHVIYLQFVVNPGQVKTSSKKIKGVADRACRPTASWQILARGRLVFEAVSAHLNPQQEVDYYLLLPFLVACTCHKQPSFNQTLLIIQL